MSKQEGQLESKITAGQASSEEKATYMLDQIGDHFSSLIEANEGSQEIVADATNILEQIEPDGRSPLEIMSDLGRKLSPEELSGMSPVEQSVRSYAAAFCVENGVSMGKASPEKENPIEAYKMFSASLDDSKNNTSLSGLTSMLGVMAQSAMHKARNMTRSGEEKGQHSGAEPQQQSANTPSQQTPAEAPKKKDVKKVSEPTNEDKLPKKKKGIFARIASAISKFFKWLAGDEDEEKTADNANTGKKNKIDRTSDEPEKEVSKAQEVSSNQSKSNFVNNEKQETPKNPLQEYDKLYNSFAKKPNAKMGEAPSKAAEVEVPKENPLNKLKLREEVLKIQGAIKNNLAQESDKSPSTQEEKEAAEVEVPRENPLNKFNESFAEKFSSKAQGESFVDMVGNRGGSKSTEPRGR